MTGNIVVVVVGGGGGGVLAVVDVENGCHRLPFQQFIMNVIGPKALVLLAVKYLGSNI